MNIAEMILYEDAELLVCRKVAGTAVQTKRIGEPDMESLLRNYLAGKGEKPYIGIVHRLDQPVEGVMVFAKNPKAAAELNRQMQAGGFGKYYLAVLTKPLAGKCGTLTDYLQKDAKNNSSAVVRKEAPGAKKAVLHYEQLEEAEGEALVRVKLETGRHHQIRVQMANAGCPLAGDSKYAAGFSKNEKPKQTKKIGESANGIALCAYRLEFFHPVSKKEMKFQLVPKGTHFHKFASLKSL